MTAPSAPSLRGATDRWALRGDRAGEGAPPLPEVMRTEAKVWRQGLRFADEIARFAARDRELAAGYLARYIGHSSLLGCRDGARAALHRAAEESTRAAGLRVVAGGWQAWPR